MNKNKKNEQFNFKELMSTPRGRAILFFGAYIIFFIAIAIVARMGGASNGISGNSEYETGSPMQFSFEGIENKNYSFTYEILIDSTSHIYKGTRTVKNELFTYNNLVKYYSNENVYFTDNNGVWTNVQNPYKNKAFLDSEMISSLIEKSSYISMTDYESGNDVYTFNISSATISKLIDNTDLDIEEVPNEILIVVNEENEVDEVKFTLDSYCKAKNICTNNMKVNLKYEMFGKIEEIANPLE